jgi:hypothetical protein
VQTDSHVGLTSELADKAIRVLMDDGDDEGASGEGVDECAQTLASWLPPANK